MKKNHVMVIDDDNYILEIYNMMLGWTPYKSFVTTEICANRAFEIIVRKNAEGDASFPDYILIDLRMPVMNGFDFIDLFEQNFPERIGQTKFIVTTSSLSQGDKEKAYQFKSVAGFLIKPIAGEYIEKLIEIGHEQEMAEKLQN